LNTGEALVVLGARASEGEVMAAGDVMNTAARLQSAAPVNGIVVGELPTARREELSGLIELWNEVWDTRSPALATIVGAPGIGKSRLVEELTREAEQDGAVSGDALCHTGKEILTGRLPTS
jgi:2-phosphoglycerate kinase